ncbi:hypothetical protein cypCar_00029560, partial [Cyprinus carpio]
VIIMCFIVLQQEQREWDTLNRLLQHHGFKPVNFADPTENKNLAELVLLERKSASDLRLMLKTLLSDSERRQGLIQELIQSSSQLKLYKSSSGEKDSSNSQKNRSTVEKATTDKSYNYKALLKSYQEQLKETKAQREELRTEIQQLKEDLETRPTIKELKTCKQQLRRLDQIIQQSNIRSSQALRTLDLAETLIIDNTIIQHLDASTCKRHLVDVCKELNVRDVSHLISAVKVQHKQAESAFKLEKILRDITAVLTNPSAPLGLLRQRAQTNLELSREAESELIVPTLEVWHRQLTSLPDLHRALIRLEKRLLPWQLEGSITAPSDPVRVEDLMLIVDTLLDETASDDKVLCSPTRHTLESMVAHFQKLFDAPSLTGIYPRMNEVYTKLGEMSSAMRNLRDVLDLGNDEVPPSEVLNKVAAIVSQSGNAAGQELYSLLESSDIDSNSQTFPSAKTLLT